MRSSSPAEESGEPIRNVHELLHVSRFWIPTREIQHESWNPDSTLKRSELALEISCQSLCFFCVLIELFLEWVGEIRLHLTVDLSWSKRPIVSTKPNGATIVRAQDYNCVVTQRWPDTWDENGILTKNTDQSMVLNLEPCSVWPGTFHQTTNALVQSHNHATELSSP